MYLWAWNATVFGCSTADVFLRKMVKNISGKAIPIRRLIAIRFYDFHDARFITE